MLGIMSFSVEKMTRLCTRGETWRGASCNNGDEPEADSTSGWVLEARSIIPLNSSFGLCLQLGDTHIIKENSNERLLWCDAIRKCD